MTFQPIDLDRRRLFHAAAVLGAAGALAALAPAAHAAGSPAPAWTLRQVEAGDLLIGYAEMGSVRRPADDAAARLAL
jgi:hypothetical protein